MKNYISKIISVVAVIIMMIPFVDWLRNPELTEMQLFLKYIWIYVACFGLYGTYLIIEFIKSKKE